VKTAKDIYHGDFVNENERVKNKDLGDKHKLCIALMAKTVVRIGNYKQRFKFQSVFFSEGRMRTFA